MANLDLNAYVKALNEERTNLDTELSTVQREMSELKTKESALLDGIQRNEGGMAMLGHMSQVVNGEIAPIGETTPDQVVESAKQMVEEVIGEVVDMPVKA